MAIVVNKEEKRANIALSCKSIILQAGIENLTISKLAKEAKVGKGTIYEYFVNKEDILFELGALLQKDYERKTLELLQGVLGEKEKITLFFTNFYEKEFDEYRQIFKEFIGISYCKTNQNFIIFQKEWYQKTYEILESIFSEGIKKNRVRDESISLIDGMINTLLGYFVLSFFCKSTEETKESILTYLEQIFITIKL